MVASVRFTRLGLAYLSSLYWRETSLGHTAGRNLLRGWCVCVHVFTRRVPVQVSEICRSETLLTVMFILRFRMRACMIILYTVLVVS